MATVLEAKQTAFPPDWTFADLQRHLGDIPASRIRLSPPPGTATVADVVAIEAHEDRLFELVDGTLVEKGMGYFESAVGVVLATELVNYVRKHKLGKILGADGMMQLFPNMVRMPDVCFLSWDRHPKRKPSEDVPAPLMAPDLVVEVISRSNTRREMQRKLEEYFAAGVRLVWYIDPQPRTATVFTAVDEATPIETDGTLDGGEVLPGFQLSLRELFDEADEQPPEA